MNNVDVWYRSLQASDEDIATYYASLSVEERDKAARYHFPRDEQRYIVGRGILRELLANRFNSRSADIQILTGPYGKPRLDPDRYPGFQFNASHSEEMISIAFSEPLRVGIDIEKIRENIDFRLIAKSFFAPEENAFVEHGEDADLSHRFLRIWTVKEAYLKAIGFGLQVNPLDFSSMKVFDGTWKIVHNADSQSWSILQVECPIGYICSVAIEGHVDQFKVHFDGI